MTLKKLVSPIEFDAVQREMSNAGRLESTREGDVVQEATLSPTIKSKYFHSYSKQCLAFSPIFLEMLLGSWGECVRENVVGCFGVVVDIVERKKSKVISLR